MVVVHTKIEYTYRNEKSDVVVVRTEHGSMDPNFKIMVGSRGQIDGLASREAEALAEVLAAALKGGDPEEVDE